MITVMRTERNGRRGKMPAYTYWAKKIDLTESMELEMKRCYLNDRYQLTVGTPTGSGYCLSLAESTTDRGGKDLVSGVIRYMNFNGWGRVRCMHISRRN
jgi:hypothetical protein